MSSKPIAFLVARPQTAETNDGYNTPNRQRVQVAIDSVVKSGSAINQMNTRVGVDDTAELAYLETKGGILERLLHLSALEEAEIATCPC